MTIQSDNQQDDSPIKFPCDFFIKVLGKNNEQFESSVLIITRRHFPDFDESNVKRRFSKDSNYLAITITVYAETKAQLDILYQDLSSSPEVIMAL